MIKKIELFGDAVIIPNFTIKEYPDGQRDLIIEIDSFKHQNIELGIIHGRFTTFLDLEIFFLASLILKKEGIKKIKLNIPYLLGGRSDRKFQGGTVAYMPKLIAPLLDNYFDEVNVLDIHSPDVAQASFKNLVNIDNSDFIKFILKNNEFNNLTIVSPDAGSEKKIYELAKKLSLNDVVFCQKNRDILTGYIIKTEVEYNDSLEFNDLLIIDDICDGGRTFIEIAKVYRSKGFKGRLFLAVTHGVFSNLFSELEKHFDHIFSTNSFSDLKNPKLTQYNVY